MPRNDSLFYLFCEKFRLAPNTAYASNWEGTDLGFATHLGGTVTTLYNEQGVATGAEFRDAEGKLLGHIVRKFDAEGRIVALVVSWACSLFRPNPRRRTNIQILGLEATTNDLCHLVVNPYLLLRIGNRDDERERLGLECFLIFDPVPS
jgi:hypothetical protein